MDARAPPLSGVHVCDVPQIYETLPKLDGSAQLLLYLTLTPAQSYRA